MNIEDVTKLPVTVQGVLLTVHNIHEVAEWCGGVVYRNEVGEPCVLEVPTMEGPTEGRPDMHWIICGVEGEFYPCEIGIFRKSYKRENEVENEGTGRERFRAAAEKYPVVMNINPEDEPIEVVPGTHTVKRRPVWPPEQETKDAPAEDD